MVEDDSQAPEHDMGNSGEVYAQLRHDSAAKSESGTEGTNPMNERQEVSEQERRDEAFISYAGYGPDYQGPNNERVEAANTLGHQKIKVDTFGDGAVTMVAQINTEKIYDPDDTEKQHPLSDPDTGKLIEGKVIDGHDLTPEAQSMKETERALQEYLANTPPEQQLIIFEGLPAADDELANQESAIRGRSDSGLVQHLARQAGVEARAAEPDLVGETKDFMDEGVSKELATAYYALRALAVPNNNGEVPTDLTMHFYAELARRGLDGYTEIPQSERQNYLDHPELLTPIKARVVETLRSGLPEINQMLASSHLPELSLGPDSSIGFAEPVTSADLMREMNPSGETELSEISRINIQSRDKRIFTTIADAVKEGKRPFVEYGGSHVISLEPVMTKYFGSRTSVQLAA